MSVGCGIAASIFNINLLYISNDQYNPELRKPTPGSEMLIHIPKPFEIYKDDKLIEGLRFFEEFHFESAAQIFQNLIEQAENPRVLEMIHRIAKGFQAWDYIDYSGAKNNFEFVISSLQKLGLNNEFVCNDLNQVFINYVSYLEKLEFSNPSQLPSSLGQISEPSMVSKISPLLIYDIFENANRDFYKSRYNQASLKFYRTIELVNQYVLFNQFQIDTNYPNFSFIFQSALNDRTFQKKMGFSKRPEELTQDYFEEWLLEQYNRIWAIIYRKSKDKPHIPASTIPVKIGLLAGVIIRHILGDSIDINDILALFGELELRNQSIYAHGIQNVNRKNCEKFQKRTRNMLNSIPREENLKPFTLKDLQKIVVGLKKIV